MIKTAVEFTSLNERFLAHHEAGNTIAVYPLSVAAEALTLPTDKEPLPAGIKLYSQQHAVILEMSQADCAERMNTIYRDAREALGWNREEWFCRLPTDDPSDEILLAAGLPIDTAY